MNSAGDLDRTVESNAICGTPPIRTCTSLGAGPFYVDAAVGRGQRSRRLCDIC